MAFAASRPSDADFFCHQLCLPQLFVVLSQGGVWAGKGWSVQSQVGTFWWKVLLPMGMEWPLRSLPVKPVWHSVLGGGQMLIEQHSLSHFTLLGSFPVPPSTKGVPTGNGGDAVPCLLLSLLALPWI